MTIGGPTTRQQASRTRTIPIPAMMTSSRVYAPARSWSGLKLMMKYPITETKAAAKTRSMGFILLRSEFLVVGYMMYARLMANPRWTYRRICWGIMPDSDA